MLKGEWGDGTAENIKVLLRLGGTRVVRGCVPHGVKGTLSRSSHLNHTQTQERTQEASEDLGDEPRSLAK